MNPMQTELTTAGVALTVAFLIAGCVSAGVLIRLWTIRVKAVRSSERIPRSTPTTIATIATMGFVIAALIALNAGRR